MSLKVLSFKAPAPEPETPVINETVVGYLKEALKMAEAGEITDLAMAFRHSDNQHTTCYDGVNRFAILGAVEYLAHRMKTLIHESD